MDFLDSVLSLDLGEEVAQILLKVSSGMRNRWLAHLRALGLSLLRLQLYQEHRGQIRTTLHRLPHKLPAYHNLEWRLDVQVCQLESNQHWSLILYSGIKIFSFSSWFCHNLEQTETSG